ANHWLALTRPSLAGFNPPGDKHGVIAVRGNHDHAVAHDADPRASVAKEPLAVSMRDWTRIQLDVNERNWLRRLPLRLTWEYDGVRFALLHATPREPLFDYRMTPSLSDLAVGELVSGVDADVLVVGHTHLPFARDWGRLRIVNPGSVGQPLDGDPRAAYALWQDGEIRLRRVTYDIDAAAEAIDRIELRPERRTALMEILRRGRVIGE
ncbi:MAG: metallophosphoesterase family protein, partial [Phycisphaerae bacterium]